MKIRILLCYLFLTAIFFGIEPKINIIDIKGTVTQRYMENDWSKVEVLEEVLPGTEFFTGFHSSISFEIGKGSYITINQLSNIVFDKIEIINNENKIRIFLLAGYAIIHSKEKRDNILIHCEDSIINFSKSGGEIYFRKDKGILITCYSGKIKVTSKLKNYYSIIKNEMCGIDLDGHIIENDYFLRRNSNTISNENKNENSITSYFDLFFQPYTLDDGRNNYFDNLNP